MKNILFYILIYITHISKLILIMPIIRLNILTEGSSLLLNSYVITMNATKASVIQYQSLLDFNFPIKKVLKLENIQFYATSLLVIYVNFD